MFKFFHRKAQSSHQNEAKRVGNETLPPMLNKFYIMGQLVCGCRQSLWSGALVEKCDCCKMVELFTYVWSSNYQWLEVWFRAFAYRPVLKNPETCCFTFERYFLRLIISWQHDVRYFLLSTRLVPLLLPVWKGCYISAYVFYGCSRNGDMWTGCHCVRMNLRQEQQLNHTRCTQSPTCTVESCSRRLQIKLDNFY